MQTQIKVHDYFLNGIFQKRVVRTIPLREKEEIKIEPIGETANSPKLQDMIYEDNVKEAIILILDKIKKGLRLNLLLYGTQGTGKTSTGMMLSAETGRPFIYLTGSMETKKIKHTLLNAKPHSIILIDEIHNLTEKVANIIYPAIQDNEIYHEGKRIRLNELMFIGTTTEPEALPKPLLDRFKLIEFEDLSIEKLQELLSKKGCNDKVINHLLNHTSNIRIINNLLDMMKIYGEVNEDNLIKVFRLKKINIYSGLSDLQERYIEVLKQLKKASLRTLSLQLSRSEEYIKSIEMDLIKKKIVNVTSKGRELIGEFLDTNYENLKKESEKHHTKFTINEREMAIQYIKENPQIRKNFKGRYFELINFISENLKEGVSPDEIDLTSFGNDQNIKESYKNNYMEDL